MNNNNSFLYNIIVIISVFLLNNSSYSQNYSLLGKLLDENNNAILFSSVVYEYLDLSGKVESNIDGYFLIDSLKKGEIIELHILPLGFSKIDTIISVSSDTVFLFFKLPCIIDGQYIDKQLAENDILKNELRIITDGGIAPVFYKNDFYFEKKYNVTFWTNGCQPVISNKCKVDYNSVIFKFLDKKYGEIWRAEIRPDVLKKE